MRVSRGLYKLWNSSCEDDIAFDVEAFLGSFSQESRFDMDGNGCLSSLEFERFLRTQEMF